MKSNSLLGRSTESMHFERIEHCRINSLKNHAVSLLNWAVEDNGVGPVLLCIKSG